MRVAQIIDNLYLVGGAQKMQVILAEAVPQTNLDITVFSLQGNKNGSPTPQTIQSLGVQVKFIEGSGLLDFKRIRKIAQILREECFDIVHTNLSYANIVGILSAKLANIPVVGSLRNAHIQGQRHQQLKYHLEMFLLKYMADDIMAVGYATAESHQGKLGRPIRAIPNAVEMPARITSQEREKIRVELVGDGQRPLIISVGRLTPQKGYSDLLTAFAEVCQHHSQAALIIAGQGKLHDELTTQINHLSLQDHVKLLGPRTDVPRLLAASDIFVSSSHWEGLSNAILEAMAAGLPVIATNVSDSPRVVVQGTGIIVPPKSPAHLAQAINSLLNDPEKTKTLGMAAQQHVATTYNPQVWVQQISSMYEAVLNR